MRERADAVLAAVIFALFARTFLFQAFEVPTSSMEKSVLTGDRLLVNKFVYARARRACSGACFRPGASVAATSSSSDFPRIPDRDFIKRVVALPGETVAIRDKRGLRRRERACREPYAFHADDTIWPDDPDIPELRRRRDQLPPLRVPDGAYFVLGDNRDDSNDSRFWGPVPAANVEGRALFVYWSVTPRSSADPSGRRRSAISAATCCGARDGTAPSSRPADGRPRIGERTRCVSGALESSGRSSIPTQETLPAIG